MPPRSEQCDASTSILPLTEGNYRTLFEHLSIGVFQCAASGRIVAANPALARTLGYATPVELACSVSDLSEVFKVEPDRQREFKGLLAEGTLSRFEAQIARPDQTRVWISVDAQCTRDAAGHILCYQGTVEDITSRRGTQQALTEQLHFIEQLLQAMPSPVFYKDEKGRYLGCNQAFEDYIGIKREALIGKTVYDIAPKDLADIYYAADQALFEQPGKQVYENQVRYADGTRHQAVFYKATFFKTGSTVGGLVGVILDISERKRAELALRRRADEFATLYELSRELAKQEDVRALLKRINERACELLDVSSATMFLCDGEREELQSLS